jgi:hypothetical protein
MGSGDADTVWDRGRAATAAVQETPGCPDDHD